MPCLCTKLGPDLMGMPIGTSVGVVGSLPEIWSQIRQKWQINKWPLEKNML